MTWEGNLGEGTANYRTYGRDYRISLDGRPDLLGSADPAFRGNPERINPEEMLVAAISSCHMLWYLHFCATAGVRVLDYQDRALGEMAQEKSGSGRFEKVILRPKIAVSEAGMVEKAQELHHQAHEYCFIANTCNCQIEVEPEVVVKSFPAEA